MRAAAQLSIMTTSLVVLACVACSDSTSNGANEAKWGEACAKEYAGDFLPTSADPLADCVAIINEYRAEQGKPALERWTSAEDCVRTQSEADATAAAAHGGFGACGEMAQNTCPGWDSVEMVLGGCLLQMYCEGPSASGTWDNAHGHHMNMVSTEYTQVACGFYQTSDGKYWANIDFK